MHRTGLPIILGQVMEDDKKTSDSLAEIFASGEAWLRKYGIVSSIAHNSIVSNLYVNFPKVRYLEYFIPDDSSKRRVWVILYVPTWKLLFTKKERMIDEVIDFLREYLDGYDIKVELKRYKKGVERSNEIPVNARDHVDSGELGSKSANEPKITDKPVDPGSETSDPV